MSIKHVVLGLGIGVVAGILIAPKKGSETREELKEGSKKLYEKSKNLSKQDLIDLINAACDKVVDMVEDFDASKIKGNTKSKLDELKVSVEELKEKAKNNENVNDVIRRMNKVAEDASGKIKAYKESHKMKNANEENDEELDEIIDEIKDEVDEIKEDVDEIKEDIEE